MAARIHTHRTRDGLPSRRHGPAHPHAAPRPRLAPRRRRAWLKPTGRATSSSASRRCGPGRRRPPRRRLPRRRSGGVSSSRSRRPARADALAHRAPRRRPLLLDALTARGIHTLRGERPVDRRCPLRRRLARANRRLALARDGTAHLRAHRVKPAARPAPGSLRVDLTPTSTSCATGRSPATEADVIPAQLGESSPAPTNRRGRFFLWDDGGPVSMAGTARLARHGTRW